MFKSLLIAFLFIIIGACTHSLPEEAEALPEQFITVLGIAQDAGYPQADCSRENCQRYWEGKESKRHVVSLGLTDRSSGQNWIFEATPDFPAQLHTLKEASDQNDLSGIFLTHAHIGHYTGLMYLGREAMGSSDMSVYAMPKMTDFLSENGPWSQLIALNNIAIQTLTADSSITLSPDLTVTPFYVPHRDEFSETVGYRIESTGKSVLFIPDINKWGVWEKDIINEIAKVDRAFIDATFYDSTELPGRNMDEIPHPYVEESVALFKDLPEKEKNKITFIHFNHTNPLILEGPERDKMESLGYRVASEGQIISLN